MMVWGPLRKTIWSGGGALFFLVCACLAPFRLVTESSRSDCCLQSSSFLLVSPAMTCSSSTLEASSSLHSPWLFSFACSDRNDLCRALFGNIGNDVFWLTTANATSLRSVDPLDLALAAGMDAVPKAIVLTETAATASMIAAAKATARTQQGCLLAQQVPRRTRLSKHTCRGQALGVAAASWGLPLHDFGEVPGTDRHRVWHYGLVLGNGVTFHLCAVYLFTGARSNAAAQGKTNVTLQALLADAALLGQQPFLIIGDWNLEPIDSVLGPQLMDGSLVDVAVAAAGVHGRTPDCTFFVTGSEGTRIDACVPSPLAARAIKECYVDLACLDVAPHRPLRLCISGAICCEPQRALKSHFGFTSAMLDSLVNDATLHSTIDRQFCSHHAELQAALLDQDIDQLWSLISATVEKALLEAASSHVSSRGISRRHVRGHFAWQQTKSCAPSASRGRRGDPAIACGAATLSSRRLLKKMPDKFKKLFGSESWGVNWLQMTCGSASLNCIPYMVAPFRTC